ncbi:hypothetical protein CJ177_43225 [Rhodococcus sp. ACPA1]|nr:hypothetical protein CJ177_43225 [Rhodococcus sp. ACPA1]
MDEPPPPLGLCTALDRGQAAPRPACEPRGMARTWLSVTVELLGGRGDDLRPPKSPPTAKSTVTHSFPRTTSLPTVNISASGSTGR